MLHVRRSIWLLFCVTLGIAIALPVADLWHTLHLPIVTQVRLIPRSATLGNPVTLVVTLQDENRALAQHRTLAVEFNMIDMPMATAPLTVVPGPQTPQYQTQLRFPMAGTWYVDLALTLPAHVPWHQELLVHVPTNGCGLTWETVT